MDDFTAVLENCCSTDFLGTAPSCNDQAELASTEFLGTAPSCNDEAELAHLSNPQPAGESAAVHTGRKRRGRKPTTLSEDERKREEKNSKLREQRKDVKAKVDRLKKIASESGGIDEMESDFGRLEQMKSRYGGFDEILSKLNKVEQMEADSAVLEKLKTMFKGTENIVPGVDKLKKIQFEHMHCKQKQMEKPFVDYLPPSSDSLKDQSNRVEHSANSINEESNRHIDKTRECGIFAVKSLNLNALLIDFIAKLETNTRSNVDFSSFKDLDGKRQRVGNYSFPMSLVPTADNIKEVHGDVTKNCLMGPTAV